MESPQNSLKLKNFKTYTLKNIRCSVNKVGPYLTLMLGNGAKTTLSVNITVKPFNHVILTLRLNLLLCNQKYLLTSAFGQSTC